MARLPETGPDLYYDFVSPYAYLAAMRADEALARGVTGIPTLAIGERLFWGDDRLEEAAASMAA